jgi:hypothetical protein
MWVIERPAGRLRSGIHFVSNFLLTEPRGPEVVFNSWLPSEGPTADFHRQAHHHVQRTPIPLRSIGPMAGIVGVLSFYRQEVALAKRRTGEYRTQLISYWLHHTMHPQYDQGKI